MGQIICIAAVLSILYANHMQSQATNDTTTNHETTSHYVTTSQITTTELPSTTTIDTSTPLNTTATPPASLNTTNQTNGNYF